MQDIQYINANEIIMPNDIKNDPYFWKYVDGKEPYLELMKNIAELSNRIKNKTDDEIQQMMIDNPKIRSLCAVAFNKRYALKIYESNGKYYFGNDGRHRIIAAQELNIEIPVYIEHTDIDFSILPLFQNTEKDFYNLSY